MTDLILLTGGYLFGWTVITALLSWLLAAFYPVIHYFTARLSAIVASPATLIYSLLAPVSALVSLFFISIPQLSFLVIPAHCHAEHCAPHLPQISSATISGFILVMLAMLALAVMPLGFCYQLWQSRQFMNLLENLKETDQGSYQIIDANDALACCVGFWSPKIYLSRGLLQSLNETELKQVLLHEHSHALRRDNLQKCLLYWATFIWPSLPKRLIRIHFNNFIERLGDLAAARAEVYNGDLNALISTINRYCAGNNHISNSENGGTTALKAQASPSRLAALNHELSKELSPQYSTGLSLLAIINALCLLLIVSSIHISHPLIEWLSH